jgi:hypothetical protein
MKKLLIATAAVTLAVGFAAPSYAAQSEFCKMMGAQRNPIGWDAYYHCYGTAAAPAKKRVVVRHTAMQAYAKSPYCKFASAQRNQVAWNAYYHCLSR